MYYGVQKLGLFIGFYGDIRKNWALINFFVAQNSRYKT